MIIEENRSAMASTDKSSRQPSAPDILTSHSADIDYYQSVRQLSDEKIKSVAQPIEPILDAAEEWHACEDDLKRPEAPIE